MKTYKQLKLHLQDNGLTEGRLVVDSGASIAMSAGSYLEVEGAIDFVLFGTENGSQVFGHRRKFQKLFT
jgi:hypothetical protein